MNWLKELVPLIGTALGGPLGGAAASFIADKLGIEEKTVEAVSDVLNTGKLSPDQLEKLKLAEIDFKKFVEANKIDLERIAAADRDSARKMQGDTRSRIPGALAIFVTLGFFGILLAIMFNQVEKTDALLVMIGSLGTAWTSIIAFYFGSSHGSQQKNELLAAK